MGGVAVLAARARRHRGRCSCSARAAPIPVFVYDRWWTVLSAGWLHGGALHILFNMMWVRQLGPAVGDIYGAARMVIIYTIAGVAGFLLSSFAGAYIPPLPFLARRAAHRRRVGADLRPARRARATTAAAAAAAWCSSEAMSYAIDAVRVRPDHARASTTPRTPAASSAATSPSMWLDPLKRERMDHFIGAAICLVATALVDRRVGRSSRCRSVAISRC